MQQFEDYHKLIWDIESHNRRENNKVNDKDNALSINAESNFFLNNIK